MHTHTRYPYCASYVPCLAISVPHKDIFAISVPVLLPGPRPLLPILL
jgi:hypothetical protein